MNTWIISDELKIGSHNQCMGVASTLGLTYKFHKINARGVWRFLPPGLWPFPLKGLKESLAAPWPKYAIAGGRASAAPTAEIGKRFGTKTIFLQNPQMDLKRFTAVIASQHDNLDSPNLLPVMGIVHALTPENLDKAKIQWQSAFESLPYPRTGVILGGDCKHHTFTKEDVIRLAETLNQWHKEGGSLLITPSRRTRPDTLADLLARLKMPYYCWDGQNHNPYLGILASADRFCVTNDSVAMMGEAAFTGKPVYAFDLNLKAKKFNNFIESMIQADHIRLAEKTPVLWNVQRLDELSRIKPQLLKLLGEEPGAADKLHQLQQK